MRLLATIAALLLSATVQAASLPSLRTDVSAAAARAQGLREQRARMEHSLDEIARRIEALKSERASQDALFHDPELDELLKRSQELSVQLSGLLASEREAEEGLAAHESRLAAELDRRIAELRESWDRATRHEERRALVPSLKSLRAEREALRRALPSASVPVLPDAPSDDPEELLERADALLDSEDKLRREERALRARSAQLQHERELERRMNDFLGEGALFDEHDRRISVSRPARENRLGDAAPSTPQAGTPETPSSEPKEDGTPREDPPTVSHPEGGFGDPASVDLGSESRGGEPVAGPHDPLLPGRQDGLEPMVDTGPRTGISRSPPERSGSLGGWSDEDSIEELEARQAQIRARAEELHRKAEEAARRARDLL